MSKIKYDIIGDIHGHADKLEELLKMLGYKYSGGHYGHLDNPRQAVFVGDFIDRGPAIRRTLEIVKGMVDGFLVKILHIKIANKRFSGGYQIASIAEFFPGRTIGLNTYQVGPEGPLGGFLDAIQQL